MYGHPQQRRSNGLFGNGYDNAYDNSKSRRSSSKSQQQRRLVITAGLSLVAVALLVLSWTHMKHVQPALQHMVKRGRALTHRQHHHHRHMSSERARSMRRFGPVDHHAEKITAQFERASFDPEAAAHEAHANPSDFGYDPESEDWEMNHDDEYDASYQGYNTTLRLMHIFPKIDTDHDQYVSYPELEAWHRLNNDKMLDNRARRYMTQQDLNHDGFLDFNEWYEGEYDYFEDGFFDAAHDEHAHDAHAQAAHDVHEAHTDAAAAHHDDWGTHEDWHGHGDAGAHHSPAPAHDPHYDHIHNTHLHDGWQHDDHVPSGAPAPAEHHDWDHYSHERWAWEHRQAAARQGHDWDAHAPEHLQHEPHEQHQQHQEHHAPEHHQWEHAPQHQAGHGHGSDNEWNQYWEREVPGIRHDEHAHDHQWNQDAKWRAESEEAWRAHHAAKSPVAAHPHPEDHIHRCDTGFFWDSARWCCVDVNHQCAHPPRNMPSQRVDSSHYDNHYDLYEHHDHHKVYDSHGHVLAGPRSHTGVHDYPYAHDDAHSWHEDPEDHHGHDHWHEDEHDWHHYEHDGPVPDVPHPSDHIHRCEPGTHWDHVKWCCIDQDFECRHPARNMHYHGHDDTHDLNHYDLYDHDTAQHVDEHGHVIHGAREPGDHGVHGQPQHHGDAAHHGSHDYHSHDHHYDYGLHDLHFAAQHAQHDAAHGGLHGGDVDAHVPAAGAGHVGHAGAGQVGAGAAQAGVGHAGAGQAGAGQAGVGHAGVGQAGAGQAGVGQAGVGHAGAGQAGVGQAMGGQHGGHGMDGAGRGRHLLSFDDHPAHRAAKPGSSDLRHGSNPPQVTKEIKREIHMARFNSADYDHDSRLSKTELLHLMNPTMSDRDALKLAALNLTLAQQLGYPYELVSHQDFVDVIWQHVIWQDGVMGHVFPKNIDFDKVQHGRDIFEYYDRNKDGYMSIQEMLPLFSTIHPGEDYHAHQSSEDQFRVVDTNHDGRLSLDEMIAHVEVFYAAAHVNDGYDYHHDDHDEVK